MTERVISNLQLLVGGIDDVDEYSDSSRSGGHKSELDELEIQSGLSSLTKALLFLHESAMIVHSNLTPQAVYVNGKVEPLKMTVLVDESRVIGRLEVLDLEFPPRRKPTRIMHMNFLNMIRDCQGPSREILIIWVSNDLSPLICSTRIRY